MNRITFSFFITLFTFCLQAQPKTDQIYVDSDGIMRWTANKKEIYGFGVNYTIPFAHEYRMAKKSGIEIEEAIRQDVYHFARLDFDLYRVHVWDTEISDSMGNLIDNEHLRLLDYLINELNKRGINAIITPIAYWGNGWPEPDENTPGFSHKYDKDQCLTNANAVKAQANYLGQFLNHVNRYTGVAYKDEPRILAFEISNEPHHHEAPEQITTFINTMVASMRQTGCTKPIFYNVSQIYSKWDAYLSADIQGATFQWYPTNLVANHAIEGNFLPQVQTYPIPFAKEPKFKKMAKIVYEFDPADVSGNIMYPAMALSFRESGMQLAAQFAYDAMCWAPYNTNYGTHFMNLAYAPNKAISLKIASAVYHAIPLYYKPADRNKVNGLRISYQNDLAEWVTNEKFFYSNNTGTQPASLQKLNEIAGVGSSPVINYTGTGAYFIDKLSNDIWRLEVMPDAYWIEDPYSPAKPNRQKAAVLHSSQQMKITIPDLGSDFNIQPIGKNSGATTKAVDGKFDITPGVYLLKQSGAKKEVTEKFKNININEFVAPTSNLPKVVIWNNSPSEITTNEPCKISFKAVSPSPVFKISVVMANGNNWKTLEAICTNNQYEVDIPQEIRVNGFINYRILIEDKNGTTKFPGGITGDPWSWDNRDDQTYTISVVPQNTRLVLWNADTDWEFSYKVWSRTVNLVPLSSHETALNIWLDQLPIYTHNSIADSSYAFKFYFKNKIKGRYAELSQKKKAIIKMNSKNAQPVVLSFIDANGSVKASTVSIEPGQTLLEFPIESFTNGNYLVIPRPYPDFVPYRVNTSDSSFDWNSIETLQFEIIRGGKMPIDLTIQEIWFE